MRAASAGFAYGMTPSDIARSNGRMSPVADRLMSSALLTVLRQADGTTLYRVTHQDGPPMLLAVCAGGRFQSISQRRLNHAYSFRNRLDPEVATVPLELIRHGGQPAMLLTDPGGTPLHESIGQPFPLVSLLGIAIGIARALGDMHLRGIVHKDLRPCNLLVDESERVFLTGFGGASLISREQLHAETVFEMTDSLAYMSPEQTGRMNRSLDTRSDLYSLGVTLYEMATGKLPFQASDPMGWVHCHIAQEAVAPAAMVPGLPPVVSDIVMRLLRKPADDRYQTAAGLEADLRRCLDGLASDGTTIGNFALGSTDVPDRLLVVEQLYGREAEISELLAAYRNVATTGRTEMVLVSGYSGIGKSAVVNELRKVLVAQHAPFAAGKLEQHKRDIPYATIAQALRSLIANLLGLDREAIASWRIRLLEAVRQHGQIVVGLVPEIEHVIGRQPALADASATESSLRFLQTIQRTFAVFGSADRPLVLFIDDLQWLDTATLELLAALATGPDSRHLLLVGAYRSNEVDAQHPLTATLAMLRKTGMPMHELVLQPLSGSDLEALVAKTLRGETAESAALAALVWDKTRGNPFFANQFLTALGDERLVWFDRASLRWQWDLVRIGRLNYSDNVADLMAQKLSRLSVADRNILMLLAGIGASATVQMLSRVSGAAAPEIHAQFSSARQAGLVTHGAGSYRFMHDRIQEAAYDLLPAPERASMHLRIGRSMYPGTAGCADEAQIFEAVNQFARCIDLLLPEERLRVAALYLAAARRAMTEVAYAAALSYAIGAARLLPSDAWRTEYRLSFDIDRVRAECEFLTGSPQDAATRLCLLGARAANLVDKASVTWLLVTVCLALDRSAQAIDVCLSFLQEVDTPWPVHPSREEVAREHALLVERLAGRPVESLLDLPTMVDPLRRAIVDVLAAVLPPAFFSDENLVCLVLCRMANLSLEYGNTDASPLAYAYLGMMVGPYFGDYATAFRLGKLGLDLVEKTPFTRYRARVYMCFSHHVIPWAKDIRSGHPLLRRAFQVSCETGDVTYAGFSSCCLVTSLLGAGEPLDRVRLEARERLDFVVDAKFGLIVDIITAQQQLVASLQGTTCRLGSFDDATFDEFGFEQHFASNRSLDIAACWYWIRKAQARFLAGEIAEAHHAISNAAPLTWTSKGHFELAEYHFYSGLIGAARGQSASLRFHRKQIDIWARHCPENFLCRSSLLRAEDARLQGDSAQAMRQYEIAVASARASAFPHVEAMALELSAKFHFSQGMHSISNALLRSARQAYERWGATGKVAALDRDHDCLRDEFGPDRPNGKAGIDRVASTVDVETLLRTSQAVASEKGLDNLMRTLMTIALEHAGADRGLLVLPQGDRLRIEASACTGQRGVGVIVRSEPATADELPLSLLHYAIRSKAHVLIDDARKPGPFSGDPYFSKSRARSVLCLPLVKQGELIGLLYLENTLAERIFTPERVAILTLLASTAATSMENASLGEKESLLQEVHHRVKNNLQLISSLLNLQASRIADPAVAELFADSRNRVRSMALVHENLYRAGNFARVPMAAHIGNLCTQLARAYGTDERKVQLTSTVQDIQLGLSRAVSCGLIVNELVSNALKHAFPGERSGEIRIALHTTAAGRHVLSVADDGVGLPSDIDVSQADSLGLQLVDDLTQQIHGELVVDRHRGTRFTVTFDAEAQTRTAP
ncbi:AAA family ATPase [Variovorax sp. RHLX14]|uniref:AAA family ATPase n=1 Tax=Variovorax sp. RHLX14 TaxID=1259731 RepID=UPI003F46BBEB